MTMTTIYIVNGKPRVGKDTFIKFMMQSLALHGKASQEFSSIQPIKDMLANAGIYMQNKTSTDRHLLSVVGDAVEQHSGFRTRKCVVFARSCNAQGKHGFIHIREPENVEKLRTQLIADGFQVHRIMVTGDRSESHNNISDISCANMLYDYLVPNQGTLGELFDKAYVLVNQLDQAEKVLYEQQRQI